jgi:signal transduction histidine kinase
VAAADNTRRRIERDLHDGAQQRLVALAMQLRAVQAAAPPDADGLREQLDDLVEQATAAVDELRELARGIHPAVLAEGGLRPVLRALARRSTVPVRLDVRGEGRLPEQVEIAAYYVVSEALTNAAKHAAASVVNVSVEVSGDVRDGTLHLRICDDGRGGADLSGGSGLVGLKDRVEALSGRLSVRTAIGSGTCVEVDLPLDLRSGFG